MRFPRSSGILLHPTSLPSPWGIGDLGAPAYRCVDWLAEADFSARFIGRCFAARRLYRRAMPRKRITELISQGAIVV